MTMQNYYTQGQSALDIKRSFSDYVIWPEGQQRNRENISADIYGNRYVLDALLKWLRENVPHDKPWEKYIYTDKNTSKPQPSPEVRAVTGIRTNLFKDAHGQRNVIYFTLPTVEWV